MLKYFLFLLLFVMPLHAEKIIQCITNFPIDPDYWTRVLVEKGYDGKVVITDIKEYDESLLKRKGKLHRLLQKIGMDYPFKAEVAENVDKIIFFNLEHHICKKYDLSRLPKDKMILFMWEPRTVLERMYHPDIQKCFSKIYTWDDSLVDGVRYFKFHYPVFTPMVGQTVPFEEKKLCTMISSDLKGTGQNELYSKRKEAIAYFQQVQETGFEFYGRRWDPSLYISYRGEVSNKTPVMQQYRFYICYENTQGVEGYITEKIFDCFAAGVVPIYWGASNVEKYIPKACFIDRRDFKNLEELHHFMKAMTKEEHELYLKNIQLFLDSESVKKFTFKDLEEAFFKAVSDPMPNELYKVHLDLPPCGMFSVFNYVVGVLDAYDNHKCAGIEVNFEKHGFYYDPHHGSNWWEYYCEPICYYHSKPSATKTFNFNEYCHYATHAELTLNRDRAHELIQKYIKIKAPIQKKIDQFIFENFTADHTIAVHYRGTDKKGEARRVDFNEVMSSVNEYINTHHLENYQIFLATDEAPFIQFMQQTFPNRVIVYSTIHSTNGEPVHLRSSENYLKGEEALIDCLLLSKADVLIRTSSNLSLWSTYFNPSLPVILMNERF